jgi:hypothetical protein
MKIDLRLILLVLAATTLQAGEDPRPKPKPWRPYEDIPEVLYYESFEFGSGAWSKGGVDDKVVQTPGSHSYKLGAFEKETVWADGNLGSLSQWHLMGGLKPVEVKIQFMLWVENPGKLHLILGDDQVNASYYLNISKVQQWQPIALDAGDFYKGKDHATDKDNFPIFRITFIGQAGKQSTAYIDDVIFTLNAKPADVLPRVLAAESKRTEVYRLASRDGFSFDAKSQELVQSALKASKAHRKVKTVLIMGSRAGEAEELKTAITAASAKMPGCTGFHFVTATAPEGMTPGGIEDIRTLLLYNLQKSDAEMALLVMGSADGASSDLPGSDGMKAIIDRALDYGCVPIFCLPVASLAGEKERTNVSRLNDNAASASKQLGTPVVDIGFVVHANAANADRTQLTPAGVQSAATLMMQAIKHMDSYVFNRK